MPFNLFDDPVSNRQVVDPRTDENFLGSLMENSLSGLAYLGKIADKTFGGRAVRGFLGGNPDELLSVLPLSDTLGITDPNRIVHGRQLTDSAGITTPGDQAWENDLASFAAEVALDPGTWFGAAVPKALARGGMAAGRAGGLGVEALSGGRFNPFTFGGRMVDNIKAPVRALFDDTVGGAWMPKVQNLAADVFSPEIRSGGYAAEMGAADANVRLARLLEANPSAPPDAVRTAMTQAAEGLTPDAALSLQRLGYGAQDTAALLDLGASLGDRARATRFAEDAQGLTSKNLLDLSDWQLAENQAVQSQNAYIRAQNAAAAKAGLPPPPLMSEAPIPFEPATQYVPRSANVFGEPPAWARRQGTGLGGASEFQISREDILRGIPGGTAKINEWAMSPELTGMNRLLPDPDATQRIVGDILGMPIAQIPLDHPAYKQAASIADMLKQLPDEALSRGLFNMDLVGNVKHRELDSVRNIASAKTAMSAIGRGFAKPIKDIMADGQRAVSLPDFLDSMRLSATDPQGFKAAHLQAAQMLGISPQDFDKFKDYGLPMDVAKDLGRIGKAWSTPEGLAPVVQAWDNAVNWFKRNLTVPFPGFHVRNLMSGIFNMWRDGDGAMGAISGPAGDAMMGLLRGREIPAEVAAKLYPGMSQQAASDAVLKELVGGKLAFVRSGQASDRVTKGVGRGVMAEELPKTFQAQPRSAAADIGDFASTFKPKAGERSYNPLNTETFVPTIAGEKVGNAVEDWIRGTHYISKRLAGESPEAAMESVLKYQVDYSKATEFEKNVMKRVMPWYCMPIDHEILTKDGWRFYDQLNVGDEVMGYDIETKQLSWTPLIQINEFDYDGELMVLECRGSSFEFTPNHRWPAYEVPRTIKGNNYGGTWGMIDGCDLTSLHKIPLVGNFQGTESILSPRLAAILGWLLTDGHIRWRGNHCEMVVYQSEKKFLENLKSLLLVEPRQATDDRQAHKVYTFAVRREDVDALTDHIQKKEQGAEVAAKLSREAAEAMFDAMMMAEGSQADTGQRHFAQSPKNWFVRDAFQVICALTGRAAFQSKAGCYVRGTQFIWPAHWARPPVKYAGKIWCPTTALGTWVVRHAGAVTITGNSYSRGNLPPILKDLAEKPAKLLGTTRAVTGTREPGEFVPPWVAEGAATPLPGAPEGQKRFISSFGLPIEDELVKTLGAAAHGDADRVMQQLFGMSIPWAKLPAEIATGTQMYSGRKLEDLKPYSFLGDILPENVARQATQVVANTPASRVASTIDKFLDTRKPTGLQLLNALTGARVTDVDLEKTKAAAAMQLLKEELRGKPGVKMRENVVIPRDQREKLRPEDLQLLDLLQEIEKRSAERARQLQRQP